MSRNLCSPASVFFRGFPCSLFLFCTDPTDTTDIFVRTRIFTECHGISAHLPPRCSVYFRVRFLFCTDTTDLTDNFVRTRIFTECHGISAHLPPCNPSDPYRPTQPHPFSRCKKASRTSAPRCKQTDWCTSSVL